MLQAQLEEKVIAQREAEQTLASYGEIENELKNLSERQEEKIREMDELVQLRDQEIAEHVASKDQLMVQLEEISESRVHVEGYLTCVLAECFLKVVFARTSCGITRHGFAVVLSLWSVAIWVLCVCRI